ncbi:hypothetical protein ABZP36_032904 [Zizania latifolia]
MGKGSELWDDSALVDAFDGALAAFKAMHKKNAQPTPSENEESEGAAAAAAGEEPIYTEVAHELVEKDGGQMDLPYEESETPGDQCLGASTTYSTGATFMQHSAKVSTNGDQVAKAAMMTAEGAMNFMRSTMSRDPGSFPRKDPSSGKESTTMGMNLNSDTMGADSDLAVVLNAWYAAGFYTSRMTYNSTREEIIDRLTDKNLIIVVVGTTNDQGLAKSSFLLHLNLSGNQLSGSPDFAGALWPLSRLRTLDLSRNQFSGPVTNGIANLHNLKAINLSVNRFFGAVPNDIGLCPHLSTVDISSNAFDGQLPDSIRRLGSLVYLAASGNRFSGDSPVWLDDLAALQHLNFSDNALTGRLPNSLGKLKDLNYLSLSKNQLSGAIPDSMSGCTKLVELHLKANDNNNLETNGRGPAAPRKRRFLSVSAMVAVCAALFIILGVIVITLLNLSARRRADNELPEKELESIVSSSTKSSKLATGKMVTFGPRNSLRSEDFVGGADALLTKATEIGRGVFGTVYRASVGEGRVVAIKKLVTANIIQSRDDIDREVRILRKAKHPNLLSLKGYYWTPQLQLLITDYAPHGSLEARLHGKDGGSVFPPLTWAERFRVDVTMRLMVSTVIGRR